MESIEGLKGFENVFKIKLPDEWLTSEDLFSQFAELIWMKKKCFMKTLGTLLFQLI